MLMYKVKHFWKDAKNNRTFASKILILYFLFEVVLIAVYAFMIANVRLNVIITEWYN